MIISHKGMKAMNTNKKNTKKLLIAPSKSEAKKIYMDRIAPKIPSRQTIINDDLSVLSNIPSRLGGATSREILEALKLHRKIFHILHRRGAPQKSAEKRKSHIMPLRFTPAECEKLQALAEQKNTTKNKQRRDEE